MNRARRLAFGCYAIVALAAFAFAARYLFGTEIMPYHLQVLGTDWASLPPGHQFMLTGFMRGVGVGFLTSGCAIALLLLIPFRRQEPWADWGLLLIVAASQIPMLCLVLNVTLNTEAHPPLAMSIALLGVALTGFVLSRRGQGTGA